MKKTKEKKNEKPEKEKKNKWQVWVATNLIFFTEREALEIAMERPLKSFIGFPLDLKITQKISVKEKRYGVSRTLNTKENSNCIEGSNYSPIKGEYNLETEEAITFEFPDYPIYKVLWLQKTSPPENPVIQEKLKEIREKEETEIVNASWQEMYHDIEIEKKGGKKRIKRIFSYDREIAEINLKLAIKMKKQYHLFGFVPAKDYFMAKPITYPIKEEKPKKKRKTNKKKVEDIINGN